MKIFLSNFDSFLCKKLLNMKVCFDIIKCKQKMGISSSSLSFL